MGLLCLKQFYSWFLCNIYRGIQWKWVPRLKVKSYSYMGSFWYACISYQNTRPLLTYQIWTRQYYIKIYKYAIILRKSHLKDFVFIIETQKQAPMLSLQWRKYKCLYKQSKNKVMLGTSVTAAGNDFQPWHPLSLAFSVNFR